MFQMHKRRSAFEDGTSANISRGSLLVNKSIVAAALLLSYSGVVGAADDRYGPAEFFKLLNDSKVRYSIAAAPVKDPVEELKCDRRNPSIQRYEERNGISLKPWVSGAEAKVHFGKAEEFYKEKKFEEAGVEYAAGLKLEPGYAAGWLYSGDVPFGLKKWDEALAAYRKAIEIDPSIAQAHRFAADALAHLGKLAEAETEYIHAIAWDPAYKEAWQALENLEKETGFRIEQHPFSPPPGMLGHTDKGVEIGVLKEDMTASPWLAYASCKAAWRFEPGFRTKRLKLSKDEPWSWTSTEDEECVESYMEAAYNVVSADREEKHQKPVEGEELIAALPDDVRFLTEVTKAGMLSAYVIFEDFGRRCPVALSLLDRNVIDEIETYIRKFVVIRIGPVGDGKTG